MTRIEELRDALEDMALKILSDTKDAGTADTRIDAFKAVSSFYTAVTKKAPKGDDDDAPAGKSFRDIARRIHAVDARQEGEAA